MTPKLVTMYLIRSIILAILIVQVKQTCGRVAVQELDDDLNLRSAAGLISPVMINGKNAAVGQFPYQAALLIKEPGRSTYVCGGSLITRYYVLTSASCLPTNTSTSAIKVVLGALHFKMSEPTQKIYRASSWKRHPDFNATRSWSNNIGLVRISYVYTDSYINTIRLPLFDRSYNKFIASISGWGTTRDDSREYADVLQYTFATVMSNEESRPCCGAIEDDIVCVSLQPGTHLSDGDEGGPLVTITTRELIGVSSFGPNKCTDYVSYCFTRVASHTDWIRDNSDWVDL